MSYEPASTEPIGAYFLGRRTRLYSILGLSIALVAVVVLATSVGSVHIPLLTTFRVLVAKLPLLDLARMLGLIF